MDGILQKNKATVFVFFFFFHFELFLLVMPIVHVAIRLHFLKRLPHFQEFREHFFLNKLIGMNLEFFRMLF